MKELSKERIEKILQEETPKDEDVSTILRSIYNRYMRLYEDYFSDIDRLNDEKIAEFQKYNEETCSIVKYYYMDIPQDVCAKIKEFEKQYSSHLLGPDWHDYLYDYLDVYKKKNKISDEEIKEKYKKYLIDSFYEVMEFVFRDGFGTNSETTKKVLTGFAGFLFGKEK